MATRPDPGATGNATAVAEASVTATARRSTRDRFNRRRFRARKVRVRILGWYALLLLAATVTSVALERQVLLTRLNRRVDAQLTARAADLSRLAASAQPGTSDADSVRRLLDSFLGQHVPARGESFLAFVDGRPYRTILTSAATPDDDTVAMWAKLTTPQRGSFSTYHGPARFVAVPIGAGSTRGVLVAMNDPHDERSDADAAVRALAVVSLSVLAVSSWFAWIVAGHVLAPLGAVTATARHLSERDLSRRIEVEGDDEVAELAHTFNTMLERLESAFRTRRDFLNDISHELRTPITIIRGHLELMGDDPAEREEVIELVTDELDRMARLVNDLLVLARAEQPGFLQADRIDVAELTTSVVAKLRGLAPREWILDATAATEITADRDRVTQALVNLANNAVAHTDDGDAIHIGSTVDGERVRFWVRDTGPGIDPALHAKIFDRFITRPPAANGKPKSAGLGLGLAIVRAIAEGHGGEVSVTSEPGEGATFELTLPRELART